MKLTIQKETLLPALQAVIGVVERRQTLAILGNVLLVAKTDGVTLTATDLEVELSARVAVSVEEPGEITIPARKLLDIVRNLPDGSAIHIQVNGEKALVRSERSRFTLSTLPAIEFPGVEEPDQQPVISLPQAGLQRLIAGTQFCMALQDVRYYLNGLLLELGPGSIRGVATDGHRLAISEISGTFESQEVRQIIVPRKGVVELARILADSEEGIEIKFSENHIRASLPGLSFTSKLIDGRYPDYRGVIPRVEENYLIADRNDLRQALIRASILSNEKFRGVRLIMEANLLTIQSNNPEQEEAEESLLVEYTGSPIETGFNATYLLDALSALDGEQVRLGFVNEQSSCLIESVQEPSSWYVVMPMRL